MSDPAPVETTECPNCSRRFVGTYCPECGQKQSPASVVDLVSGFLREVVDLDGGFWPTLTHLTTRPGYALRRYLQGARRSYMHPGRYLLAAVVIATLITQGMAWTGVMTGAGPADVISNSATTSDSTSATPDSASTDTSSAAYQLGYVLGQMAEGSGMVEETDTMSTDSAAEEEGASQKSALANPVSALGNHNLRMLFAVTMAMFLGLVYRRMFPRELQRLAPALAMGMFVTAHLTILEHAVHVPITLIQYAWTGEPVEPGSNVLSLFLLLFGGGLATGACFGQGGASAWPAWRAGLKGGIATIIAQLDTVAVFVFSVAVYGGVRSFRTPGGIPPGHPLFIMLAVLVVLGVAVLVLPHVGLLLYRRYRSGDERGA